MFRVSSALLQSSVVLFFSLWDSSAAVRRARRLGFIHYRRIANFDCCPRISARLPASAKCRAPDGINHGQLTLSPFHRVPVLFLQIATELPPSPACFVPRSRSNRAQKISSQLCDGSIKAEHGTPSTTSSIAPAARV